MAIVLKNTYGILQTDFDLENGGHKVPKLLTPKLLTFLSKTDKKIKYDATVLNVNAEHRFVDVCKIFVHGSQAGATTHVEPQGWLPKATVVRIRPHEVVCQQMDMLFNSSPTNNILFEHDENHILNLDDDGDAWTRCEPRKKTRFSGQVEKMPRPCQQMPWDIPKPEENCSIPHTVHSHLNDHYLKRKNELLRDMKQLTSQGLTEERYKEFWTAALYCEEFHNRKLMAQFKMNKTLVTLNFKGGERHMIEVPGVLDNYPTVLMMMSEVVLSHQGEKHTLIVEDVNYIEVLLRPVQTGVFQRFLDKFPQEQKTISCGIDFVFNPYVFECMHKAVGRASMQDIACLFSKDRLVNYEACVPDPSDIKLFNENLRNNEEQMQAICNIMAGTSRPYPYILFGPPGTGKTATVVEAILQVWKRDAKNRIIVAASSNAAADVLAKRLIAYIPSEHVIRWLARYRECLVPDKDLIDVVMYGRDGIVRLEKVRLVVVTLASCARLVPYNSYTHVFIDEAGQAMETESLIALAGRISTRAHITMCGDPFQLGPVIKSNLAREFNLSTSLLERLMTESKMYHMDKKTRTRDPRVITKLVKNFRSHEKLLHIPNELFYDDELVPCADRSIMTKLKDAKLKWLPKADFPLLFHAVDGNHERVTGRPSLFNEKEIQVVLDYVTKLIKSGHFDEKDIGILTPYTCQGRKIRERLKSGPNNSEILVGTTEVFQGQERMVMIVSTVRASSSHLGFLDNTKRFNVAITRAQALLIVVGDPRLLSRDRCWEKLIDYAEHARLN